MDPMNSLTLSSSEQYAYRQFTREMRVSPGARALYNRSIQMGWMRRLLFHLPSLKDLQQALGGKPVSRRYSEGLQTVPVKAIIGSEGRTTDFDIEFHPIKKHSQYRWLRVATARDEWIPIPPVELIRLGNEYFVRDGHHRISVAKARGEKDIEAEVTVIELD